MLILVDSRLGAHPQPSAPGGVSLDYAVHTIDSAACREIGTLDVVHKLRHRALRIVHAENRRVNYLAEVVRRNVCRHTDGNSDSTVHKKVREPRRQHRRLLARVVKVPVHPDNVLFKVAHHLVGKTRQSCLGVTVSRSRVAVNRTEVSLALYKRIAVGKILRHSDHRAVNGRVAVRMITTEDVTDRRRRFAERVVVSEVVLIHGVKYTPLSRLHTVAHIRKRTRYDNAHSILDKRGLDLFFHMNVYDLLVGIFVVLFFFSFIAHDIPFFWKDNCY